MFRGVTTMNLDTQLGLLYADKSMQLEVEVPKIQQQVGGTDCGLFAAAVVTAIATGSDPIYLTWIQTKIRDYFIQGADLGANQVHLVLVYHKFEIGLN